jgi:hypothetical protein
VAVDGRIISYRWLKAALELVDFPGTVVASGLLVAATPEGGFRPDPVLGRMDFLRHFVVEFRWQGDRPYFTVTQAG